MTSMIDVVFLLLVFFICASVGSVADRLLPASLQGNSQTVSETAADDSEWQLPPILIRLQPGTASAAGAVVEPEVLLDRAPLSGLQELTERLTALAAADRTAPVVLSIHDDIEVQHFVRVYDLCQRLKLEKISFAVSKPAAGAPE
jgi:biopolymer transport protein ExbD